MTTIDMHLRRIGPPASSRHCATVMCFHRPITFIGRLSSQADYVLSSTNIIHQSYISRQHARVVKTTHAQSNTYKIYDDSRNGIFVNNYKIAASVVLNEGDCVTFGHRSGETLQPGDWVRQPDSEYQYVFERCQCPQTNQPRALMNIPENVLNIPENVLNIPENLLNILENVQNCPGNAPNISENAPNISENAPKSSENVPNNSRNIAATSSTRSPLISNQTSGSASLEIATNFSVPTAIPQKTAETLSHRAKAQLPVPKNETQSKSTSQIPEDNSAQSLELVYCREVQSCENKADAVSVQEPISECREQIICCSDNQISVVHKKYADTLPESRPNPVIETDDLEQKRALGDCNESKQGLVHETLKEPVNQEINIEDDADNVLESQPNSVIKTDDLEQKLVLGVFENSKLEPVHESLKQPEVADDADNVLELEQPNSVMTNDLEQKLALGDCNDSKQALVHETFKEPGNQDIEIEDDADNVLESRPNSVIETNDLEQKVVLGDCNDSKQELVHETLKEPGNQEIEIEDDADIVLESRPNSVIETDDSEQKLVLGVFDNSKLELVHESLKQPETADENAKLELVHESLKQPEIADDADNVLESERPNSVNETENSEQKLVIAAFENSKPELFHESLIQPEIADDADNVLESERPNSIIETDDLERKLVLGDCNDSKQGLVHETLKEPGNQDIEIEDDADNVLESRPNSVIETNDLKQKVVLGDCNDSKQGLVHETLKEPGNQDIEIEDDAVNVLESRPKSVIETNDFKQKVLLGDCNDSKQGLVHETLKEPGNQEIEIEDDADIVLELRPNSVIETVDSKQKLVLGVFENSKLELVHESLKQPEIADDADNVLESERPNSVNETEGSEQKLVIAAFENSKLKLFHKSLIQPEIADDADNVLESERPNSIIETDDLEQKLVLCDCNDSKEGLIHKTSEDPVNKENQIEDDADNVLESERPNSIIETNDLEQKVVLGDCNDSKQGLVHETLKEPCNQEIEIEDDADFILELQPNSVIETDDSEQKLVLGVFENSKLEPFHESLKQPEIADENANLELVHESLKQPEIADDADNVLESEQPNSVNETEDSEQKLVIAAFDNSKLELFLESLKQPEIADNADNVLESKRPNSVIETDVDSKQGLVHETLKEPGNQDIEIEDDADNVLESRPNFVIETNDLEQKVVLRDCNDSKRGLVHESLNEPCNQEIEIEDDADIVLELQPNSVIETDDSEQKLVLSVFENSKLELVHESLKQPEIADENAKLELVHESLKQPEIADDADNVLESERPNSVNETEDSEQKLVIAAFENSKLELFHESLKQPDADNVLESERPNSIIETDDLEQKLVLGDCNDSKQGLIHKTSEDLVKENQIEDDAVNVLDSRPNYYNLVLVDFNSPKQDLITEKMEQPRKEIQIVDNANNVLESDSPNSVFEMNDLKQKHVSGDFRYRKPELVLESLIQPNKQEIQIEDNADNVESYQPNSVFELDDLERKFAFEDFDDPKLEFVNKSSRQKGNEEIQLTDHAHNILESEQANESTNQSVKCLEYLRCAKDTIPDQDKLSSLVQVSKSLHSQNECFKNVDVSGNASLETPSIMSVSVLNENVNHIKNVPDLETRIQKSTDASAFTTSEAGDELLSGQLQLHILKEEISLNTEALIIESTSLEEANALIESTSLEVADEIKLDIQRVAIEPCDEKIVIVTSCLDNHLDNQLDNQRDDKLTQLVATEGPWNEDISSVTSHLDLDGVEESCNEVVSSVTSCFEFDFEFKDLENKKNSNDHDALQISDAYENSVIDTNLNDAEGENSSLNSNLQTLYLVKSEFTDHCEFVSGDAFEGTLTVRQANIKRDQSGSCAPGDVGIAGTINKEMCNGFVEMHVDSVLDSVTDIVSPCNINNCEDLHVDGSSNTEVLTAIISRNETEIEPHTENGFSLDDEKQKFLEGNCDAEKEIEDQVNVLHSEIERAVICSVMLCVESLPSSGTELEKYRSVNDDADNNRDCLGEKEFSVNVNESVEDSLETRINTHVSNSSASIKHHVTNVSQFETEILKATDASSIASIGAGDELLTEELWQVPTIIHEDTDKKIKCATTDSLNDNAVITTTSNQLEITIEEPCNKDMLNELDSRRDDVTQPEGVVEPCKEDILNVTSSLELEGYQLKALEEPCYEDISNVTSCLKLDGRSDNVTRQTAVEEPCNENILNVTSCRKLDGRSDDVTQLIAVEEPCNEDILNVTSCLELVVEEPCNEDILNVTSCLELDDQSGDVSQLVAVEEACNEDILNVTSCLELDGRSDEVTQLKTVEEPCNKDILNMTSCLEFDSLKNDVNENLTKLQSQMLNDRHSQIDAGDVVGQIQINEIVDSDTAFDKTFSGEVLVEESSTGQNLDLTCCFKSDCLDKDLEFSDVNIDQAINPVVEKVIHTLSDIKTFSHVECVSVDSNVVPLNISVLARHDDIKSAEINPSTLNEQANVTVFIMDSNSKSIGPVKSEFSPHVAGDNKRFDLANVHNFLSLIPRTSNVNKSSDIAEHDASNDCSKEDGQFDDVSSDECCSPAPEMLIKRESTRRLSYNLNQQSRHQQLRQNLSSGSIFGTTNSWNSVVNSSPILPEHSKKRKADDIVESRKKLISEEFVVLDHAKSYENKINQSHITLYSNIMLQTDAPDKNVSSIDGVKQEKEMVIPSESQICTIKTSDDPDKNVSSIDVVEQEKQEMVIPSESQICAIKTSDDPDKNVSSIHVVEQEQEMVILSESQFCTIKTSDAPDKNVSCIDVVEQEQEMVIRSASQICAIKTGDDSDKNVSSIDVVEQEQEMVILNESQICAIKTSDDPDKIVSSIDVVEQEQEMVIPSESRFCTIKTSDAPDKNVSSGLV